MLIQWKFKQHSNQQSVKAKSTNEIALLKGHFHPCSALSPVLGSRSSWVHSYTTWVSQQCLCSLVGSPWCLTGSSSNAGPLLHAQNSFRSPWVLAREQHTKRRLCVGTGVSAHECTCGSVLDFVQFCSFIYCLFLQETHYQSGDYRAGTIKIAVSVRRLNVNWSNSCWLRRQAYRTVCFSSHFLTTCDYKNGPLCLFRFIFFF